MPEETDPPRQTALREPMVAWKVVIVIVTVGLGGIVVRHTTLGNLINQQDKCFRDMQAAVTAILEYRRDFGQSASGVSPGKDVPGNLMKQIDSAGGEVKAQTVARLERQSDEWLLLASGRIYSSAERWKSAMKDFRILSWAIKAMVALVLLGIAAWLVDTWRHARRKPDKLLLDEMSEAGTQILERLAGIAVSAPFLLAIAVFVMIVVAVCADLRYTASAASRDIEHKYLLKDFIPTATQPAP